MCGIFLLAFVVPPICFHRLREIFCPFSDPEIALDYSSNPDVDSETFELMKQIWTEQFENVGIRLLSRLNFYHTDLEPLAQDPNLL